MMITATKKAYAMWSIHRLTMVSHYNYNTATVCYTNQWRNTCSINGITCYTAHKLSIYRGSWDSGSNTASGKAVAWDIQSCRPLRGIRRAPQLHNGSAKVINNGHHLTLTIHFVASLLNGGRVCIHLLYCIRIVITSISVLILDVALQIHYRTRCTHSRLWVYCGILEARGRCIRWGPRGIELRGEEVIDESDNM